MTNAAFREKNGLDDYQVFSQLSVWGFNLERLSTHHPPCIKGLWIGLRDLSYLEKIWLEHIFCARYYFPGVITKIKEVRKSPSTQGCYWVSS